MRFRIFVNILETFWLSIAVSNSGAFYEYNRDGPKPCLEGEGRRAVTCDQAVFGRPKKKARLQGGARKSEMKETLRRLSKPGLQENVSLTKMEGTPFLFYRKSPEKEKRGKGQN